MTGRHRAALTWCALVGHSHRPARFSPALIGAYRRGGLPGVEHRRVVDATILRVLKVCPRCATPRAEWRPGLFPRAAAATAARVRALVDVTSRQG